MYTKLQQDMAWSLFALYIKQGKQVQDMQTKWDEMAKQSALKNKIIAECKMNKDTHVKEVVI